MKWSIVLLFLFLYRYDAGANPGDTIYRNVRISFLYRATIFPSEWQQSPINASAEVIDGNEIQRSSLISIKALSKYPPELLRLNLRTIYWVRKMTFYNVGYGGTNSTFALYLTNDGEKLGYTDNYLEQTFHHEFSSILLRNYPAFLDTMAWKAANDPGFRYNDPEDGVGAIRNNASSQELDTSISSKGLLTQYAMSSIENDVNTFAQNLFTPSTGFWEIVERYPRVKRKLQLMILFYNRIHPLFTENYFKRFNRVKN